jgi:hypothetical protein
LHSEGYVHGDIRGFNIILNCIDGNNGCLIDFDFGEKDHIAIYPNGYKRKLDDGNRRGEDGTAISKSDDWYALVNFIFICYRFIPPKEGKFFFSFFNKRKRLQLAGQQLKIWDDMIALSDENIGPFIPKLEKFLIDTTGANYEMRMIPDLKKRMNNTEDANMHLATGSPLKK